MNQAEFIQSIISGIINQSLINQRHYHNPLPDDQKKAQEDMLKALHDLFAAANKIEPQYRPQVGDSCVLKIATELGLLNNPNGGTK